MPATSQKKMKLCRDVSFSHVAFHEPTGTHFSIPPKDLKHNTWSQEVPQGLKDEIHNVLIKNHGEGADEVFKINSYRMCWSVTGYLPFSRACYVRWKRCALTDR